MSTYILIAKDGTKKEVPFLIKNGEEYVTEHFSRVELDRDHAVKPIYFEPTLNTLEGIRKITGPFDGLSGYRSHEKQTQLYNEDVREHGGKPSHEVARPGSSPHEYGFAVDCAIPKGYTADTFQLLMAKVSKQLGYGVCRRGYRAYKGRFVHMDLAYLAKNLNIDKPNPFPTRDWAEEVTW